MRSRRRFGRERVVAELMVRCSSVQFLVDRCPQSHLQQRDEDQSVFDARQDALAGGCQAMELRLVFFFMRLC